jgi:class 3 adenylate cyclase
MKKKAGISLLRFVSALLLGGGIVGIVAAAHLLGMDRRAEELALDLRYGIKSQTRMHEDLRLLLLDDRALEALGRWPWDRSIQAGVLQALNDAGAPIIALDIVLSDPQPVRYVSDRWDVYDPGEHFVGQASAQPVFDDARLEKALASCQHLLLPIVMRPPESPLKAGAQAQALLLMLRDDPGMSLTQARERLGQTGSVLNDEDLIGLYLHARGVQRLRSQFGLSPRRLASPIAPTGTPVPPLIRFLEQAQGVGFVNFFPGQGGVLRDMPLLMQDGRAGKFYPQMGLELARSYLSRMRDEPCRIETAPGWVLLRKQDGSAVRIPVNDQGQMRVPWIRREDIPDNSRISLARPGLIYLNRQKLQRNWQLRRLCLEELAASLGQEELIEAFSDLRLLEQKQRLAELDVQRARLYQPGKAENDATKALETRIAELEGRIEPLCKQLADPFYLQGLGPEDPLRVKIESLLERVEEIGRANTGIRSEIQQQLAQLRSLVDGKVCLLGAEATTLGDFVPTPSSKRLPGVYVHANVFSGIVSGDFIYAMPTWGNLAVLLGLGLSAVLLSVLLPVVWSFGAVLALVAGYIVINSYVLFAWQGVWVALVSPASAGFLGFVFVTVYRELTEEREKRRIRSMFSHTLSEAMVDRLLADPNIADLGGGERRVATFFFSDLQGFTGLVEQIGENRAVQLLNEIFDRATFIIEDRHGGYLNKFLGDGVFAIFGAPVAREDHARRAVDAALDCCREVAAVCNELPARLGIPVDLRCRIGLATGDVMVGNCGSSRRWDISAIGDAVNLASRLEAACKILGTGNLVADSTFRQGVNREEVVARPLGPIRVVGRNEPVFVWNLLGRPGRCSRETIELAQAFDQAFALHQQHDHLRAREAFDQLARRFPEDLPCRILRDWALKSAQQGEDSLTPDIIELNEKGK